MEKPKEELEKLIPINKTTIPKTTPFLYKLFFIFLPPSNNLSSDSQYINIIVEVSNVHKKRKKEKDFRVLIDVVVLGTN